MDLTSTSLDSKEVVSCIKNAFKNFVIRSLHSGMCRKSKFRVYREQKEARSTYMESLTCVNSKLLFRFRSETCVLNEELGRHSSRNSNEACIFFVSVSASL